MIAPFSYDPKPCYCPLTGEYCSDVKEECLSGGCGLYWEKRNTKDKPGTRKMCIYWSSCLFTCFDGEGGCTGTIEESEERGCDCPFVIVEVQG